MMSDKGRENFKNQLQQVMKACMVDASAHSY